MLRSTLLSHPNVVVHGEMFNPGAIAYFPYGLEEEPEKILRNHIYRPYVSDIQAVGFPIHDLQFFAPQNKHWANVWNVLSGIDDLLVINLQRRNLAEQFVSNIKAHLSGQWWLYYRKPPQRQQKQVYCKPDKMMEYFSALEKRQEEIEPKFSKHEQITVHYEDLLSDFHPEMQRIQKFIGAEPMQLLPRTTKQDVRPLRDRITNYQELKDHFSDTPYSVFFS